jgi:hypothetical protein
MAGPRIDDPEIRLAGCFGHDFHGSFMQIPAIDRTVDLPS